MTRRWVKPISWGVIKLIVLLCFATIAWGEQSHHPWLRENAPQSYQVQPGDTLWEIAGKFLHNPWHWRQIWHANPEIDNPNLIFPGDRIVLTTHNGKPRLYVERGQSIRTVDKQTGVIRLHPRIRELPPDRAVPTIPLHIIKPFLNASRVVSSYQAKHCPQIIALDEDHILIGAGDLFYVTGLSARSVDDIYAVFRPEKSYLDPDTKAFLGIEGLVLGKAQIERPGDPARLILTQTFAEVKIGDRIMGTSKEEIDPNFIPKYPQGDPEGKIISVFGGVTQIGQYQVLVVTGGKDQKREIGDVLAIFQTNKDIPLRLLVDTKKHYKYPPYRIGTSVVFRVFDKVSYVLVMNATRPIYLLDDVGKP